MHLDLRPYRYTQTDSLLGRHTHVYYSNSNSNSHLYSTRFHSMFKSAIYSWSNHTHLINKNVLSDFLKVSTEGLFLISTGKYFIVSVHTRWSFYLRICCKILGQHTCIRSQGYKTNACLCHIYAYMHNICYNFYSLFKRNIMFVRKRPV
jgi:hypothetical protein